MLIIGSAVGFTALFITIYQLKRREKDMFSKGQFTPRVKTLVSTFGEKEKNSPFIRQTIEFQEQLKKQGMVRLNEKEFPVVSGRNNTKDTSPAQSKLKKPAIPSANEINKLFDQFIQGKRGIELGADAQDGIVTRFICVPLVYSIHQTKDSLLIKADSFHNRSLFEYSYSYKKKETACLMDKTPVESKEALLRFLQHVIEEFGTAPGKRNTAYTRVSQQRKPKSFHRKSSIGLLAEPNRKVTPVQPNKIQLSTQAKELLVEIDKVLLAIQVNKDFQFLPVDVSHRVEVLETDYDKLLTSFQSSSDASTPKKEEALLIGLRMIRDKLNGIYTHIGELEYNDLLRQIKTIEQR